MRQHATVRAACVQVHLSPLRFHGWAAVYWQEYEALSDESRESSVAYLLLCRAIELEFKAWHRQAIRAYRLIDRFRHDLVASYWALPKKYQVLSVDELSVLEQATSVYLRQGFENAEVCRGRMEFAGDVEIGDLLAVAQKIMGHGDRLNLRWR